MKIIFVHGRAQHKKSVSELEQQWTTALHDGFRQISDAIPTNLEIAFPYYGNLLFDLTEQAIQRTYSRTYSTVMHRGSDAEAPSAEELAFNQEIVREIAHAKGVSDADIATAANTDVDLVERGVLNWPAVLAALRLLDGIPDFTSAWIELLLKDTWYYLTNKGIRLQIHEVVRQPFAAEQPCIVVAHSLGSVVAYNLLMERKARSNIKSFITLGSPLGMAAIYKRLPSDAPPRKAPSGVGSWLNARDAQDTVALHEVPGRFFEGNPVVRNYSQVENRSDNRHGIADYLRDPIVAKAIHEAVQSG